MTRGPWTSYDFAVVRVVPHVHLGCFVNGGVVVPARNAEYLAARLLTDPARLRERVPDLDPDRLSRYLLAYGAVVEGKPEAGPVALVPPSERFHWLTAHRSDVLQTSPIHEGLCRDPALAIAELYAAYVRP
jgi:hypothetical protein